MSDEQPTSAQPVAKTRGCAETPHAAVGAAAVDPAPPGTRDAAGLADLRPGGGGGGVAGRHRGGRRVARRHAAGLGRGDGCVVAGERLALVACRADQLRRALRLAGGRRVAAGRDAFVACTAGAVCVKAAHAGFCDNAQWRVFGIALGDAGRMLYVAQTRAERAEAQVRGAPSARCWRRWLSAPRLTSGSTHWCAGSWAPVQRLSDRLAAHEPLAAGATLGRAERAELETVHRSIDQLGQRLAQRLAHERAFTAQAAHALRTPLAGIDAQLAVCLRESPAELQPRLQRAREAAGRLQRVVVALLTLFRSDGEPVREAVDLAPAAAAIPDRALAGRPAGDAAAGCRPRPARRRAGQPARQRAAPRRVTCARCRHRRRTPCAWTTTARA